MLALTNNTGTIQTSYTYDPFGNTTQSGTASTNPIQYTGRENDGTGLYYYRARYYSPALGRFISSDPIGLNGGINTYSYVLNNPMNWVDPSGLDAEMALALVPVAIATAMADSPLPGPADIVAAGIIVAAAIMPGDTAQNSEAADAEREKSGAKGVPACETGPSGKPKRHNVNHPGKKKAREAAQQDGRGPPMHHPSPTAGSPHYHPTDADGNKIPGTHHNY